MQPLSLVCGLRVCCWSHSIFRRHWHTPVEQDQHSLSALFVAWGRFSLPASSQTFWPYSVLSAFTCQSCQTFWLPRVADAFSHGFDLGLCCTEKISGAAFWHFLWLEDLLLVLLHAQLQANMAFEEGMQTLILFCGLRVGCSLLCTPSWAAQVHTQPACHFTYACSSNVSIHRRLKRP